jgi:hypothetical protein
MCAGRTPDNLKRHRSLNSLDKLFSGVKIITQFLDNLVILRD